MDEESTPELSAARRRGAIRRLLWPHGKRTKPKDFMHGRRWRGVALVLLVCALTVVGIVIFSGRPDPPVQIEGNEGVLSLYDFFREYARNKELQSGGPIGTLTDRLMKEPFEISAQMTVESEGLQSFGIPLTSVPAEFNIKYDLRDLGVKANVIGMDIFKAYVTDDQLIIEQGGAEPSVAELPVSSDVSGDMPLGERIRAFAPYLSENAASLEQLFGLLAQSVPEECTEMQLGRAYSPVDGGDVNVTLINTAMDEKALAQAADAFAEKIKGDEALYEQTQDIVTAVSAAFGTKGLTLDSLLTRLENEDFAGTTVTWKVYRRDDTPIGFAVIVTTADAQYDLTRMAEFDGAASYEHAELFVNGSEVFKADYIWKSEDNAGTLSAALHSADGETISINGAFAIEPYTNDSYHIEADIDVIGKLLREEEDTVHAKIDARVDLGNGLGMLADSRGWQDIEEWKEPG
jgi:hypothetical protein